SLDWHENHHPLHNGVQKLIKDLNEFYKKEPALYERDFDPDGFEWIDFNDSTNSVICWKRKRNERLDDIIFVGNFAPVVRENYRIGLQDRGFYKEILSSDDLKYGGSNLLNNEFLETTPISRHRKPHSISLIL